MSSSLGLVLPTGRGPLRRYYIDMSKSEDEFVAWLAGRYPREGADDGVILGVGDDMALIRPGGSDVLLTSDMLMDGVDFDARIHTPQQIGRKALAVSLSDCAAMAVRPRWVSVTVALPDNWSIEQAQGLYLGMEPLAEAHCCRIIGGDTNSWSQGLVIETCVVAEPWPGLEPVRRGGVRPGDWICVTGALGGSLAGHHLEFEPAVATAFNLATGFKGRLKAMMDISDGLSIDAARMARASACTIQLEEAGLGLVVSDAAIAASRADHRTPLEHALHDGEDFELLFALAPEAATALGPGQAAVTTPAGNAVVAYTVIGRAEKGEGLWLLDMSGHRRRIEPAGWQHFVK